MSPGIALEAKVNRELESLADEIGNFIRYWGFKKIHGRIWTYIYLSAQTLDATTLIQRLNVSKALMSLSLNDLLNYNVIVLAGKSPRGTQLYAANPQVLEVILSVLKQREKNMLFQIAAAHRALREIDPDRLKSADIHTTRLESLGQIIKLAEQTLEGLFQLGELDLTHGNLNGSIFSEL